MASAATSGVEPVFVPSSTSPAGANGPSWVRSTGRGGTGDVSIRLPGDSRVRPETICAPSSIETGRHPPWVSLRNSAVAPSSEMNSETTVSTPHTWALVAPGSSAAWYRVTVRPKAGTPTSVETSGISGPPAPSLPPAIS